MAPLAIRAAIAAPFKPIAGMGPKPKIIIGSIMIFAIEAMIISKLGRRVSPVALILLIPTIPTTTKGTPKYNISMYPLIRGIISFGAPRDKKQTVNREYSQKADTSCNNEREQQTVCG